MLKKVLFGALLLTLVPVVKADSILTFTLDQDACSGTCGTSPFGTVTLTQVDASTVQVGEQLLNGDKFIRTGAGQALEFNITGDPAITITGLTSGFSVGPAPASASAFGSFDYSIHCSGCGPGASSPLPGPISFNVVLTGGGNLSINDFIANSGGYFFASDILGNNGKTGNVGTKGPGVPSGGPTPVPEPTTGLLLAAGLVGLWWFGKTRRS